jgi:2-keto-4-pentenoate hydratase/2-oxohepta-3-ene-1,7-dioic acid hydratase in catechol pathway
MQHDSTEHMIFGVSHLIWYLSQFLVLEPGDLINTGTPSGVALGMTTPQYLRPGDVIDAWGHGLGRQRNTCVAWTAPSERTR